MTEVAVSPTFINGPMHPDLFDGQTPARVQVESLPIKVFKVDVRFTGRATVRVVATSEDEAEEIASRMDVEDVAMYSRYSDTEDCTAEEAKEEASEDEIKHYLARREGKKGMN